MAHPDWVLKFKLKNTDIRCIRGKYYLYATTSKWCPEKGRTKKVTLKYIGSITEEHGLIPAGMVKKGRVPKGESRIKNVNLKEMSGFMDTFESLEDPRSSRNQLYTMDEILFCALCAVICGAEGFEDMEDFGTSKSVFLKMYFPYENGTPSDDTFRRFFRSLNPEKFEELFRQWANDIADRVGAKVISIDGKCSRRSYDGKESMLHRVSAFASEARLVLGQSKVDDKSNEITAIPKLLEWLDIKGHIITIDAMGCQYSIADLIQSKEGDYVLALKGNQSSLSDDVSLYFEEGKIQKPEPFTDYDKGHGRIETRTCCVVTDVQWLKDRHPKWASIQSIIQVKSKREIKEKGSEETRYYISSLIQTPQEALKAIRSHWAIENTLHWTLDMSFNEDYSRIRKQNAPHIMATLRHAALNLLQRAKTQRQSIKRLRKIAGWDILTLQSILSQKIS